MKFPSFLKTAAIIRYIAIALIGTGIYEHSDARVTLGVGLLVPSKFEQVDEKLQEANK